MAVALLAGLVTCVVGYRMTHRVRTIKPATGVRNIVLISVDTLRADHLSSHGYHRPTSPNIDRLGQGGVVLLNAVAQSPSTLPSHASIFTSRYASQHKTIKDGLSYTELDESELTLAEILKSEGYSTAAFTDGGETAKVFNLDQGFDVYDDEGGGIARINHKVFKWLAGKTQEKFFLFVHCYDTHAPYAPAPPYHRMFPQQALKVDLNIKNPTPADEERFLNKTIADYDAEIAYTDKHVGALLDRIERLGLTRETLIIFTSDHGEEFLEHKRLGHSEHVYDESIKVPLVFANPGIQPARKLSIQVSSVDITPTVLDVLGLPIPSRMKGRSLLKLLSGIEEPEPPAFSENEHRTQVAIRTSTHKLIVDSERSSHQFFDLRSDPSEQRSLTPPRRPAEYLALLKKMKRWRREVDQPAAKPQSQKSLAGDRAKHKRVLEQLKSLGYIQ